MGIKLTPRDDLGRVLYSPGIDTKESRLKSRKHKVQAVFTVVHGGRL